MTEQPAADVELVIFEIGGERFGADASQILRIGRPSAEATSVDALGELARGHRALVFQTDAGERQLMVDAVLGVRPVSVDSLRRCPEAAGHDSYAIGIWLDGEQPVVLIDLSETLNGRQ